MGTFLDLLGSLGAKVDPGIQFETILVCSWGGFGSPCGTVGLPLAAGQPKQIEKSNAVSLMRCDSCEATWGDEKKGTAKVSLGAHFGHLGLALALSCAHRAPPNSH